jgi:short-subunit dehydrogenase
LIILNRWVRAINLLNKVALNLKQKYNIEVIVIPQDLSLIHAGEALYQNIKDKNIEVNILVNNAGVGTNGNFTEINFDLEISLLQLNIITLVTLCKLFIQDMKKAGNGKILNIASTAAFQPGPYMSNYYASKAYVLNFSEALYQENKNTDINISTLCPGATRTEFFNNAGMGNSSLATSIVMMDAKKVAEIGYAGLMKNKPVIIPGVINKILVQAVRFTPRF